MGFVASYQQSTITLSDCTTNSLPRWNYSDLRFISFVYRCDVQFVAFAYRCAYDSGTLRCRIVAVSDRLTLSHFRDSVSFLRRRPKKDYGRKLMWRAARLRASIYIAKMTFCLRNFFHFDSSAPLCQGDPGPGLSRARIL